MQVRMQRLLVGSISLLAAAILYLSQVASPPQHSLDLLLQQLQSPDRATRCLAVRGIRQHQYVAPELIPPLLDAVQDTDPNLREAAAEALAEVGRAGQVHLPKLTEIYAAEKNPRVQTSLRHTIERISNAQH